MNGSPTSHDLHVLVADGCDPIAERLSRLVLATPGIGTCHLASSADELRAQLSETCFDVLLIDMFLPGSAATELLPDLTLPPDCVVIVLGPDDCAQLFRRRQPDVTTHYFSKSRELPRTLSLLSQLAGRHQTNCGAC